MSEPSIRVLGVCKPEIPSSVYREPWQVTESDSATEAHFERLVLIEGVVSYADERFTMKDLGRQWTSRDFDGMSSAPAMKRHDRPLGIL